MVLRPSWGPFENYFLVKAITVYICNRATKVLDKKLELLGNYFTTGLTVSLLLKEAFLYFLFHEFNPPGY